MAVTRYPAWERRTCGTSGDDDLVMTSLLQARTDATSRTDETSAKQRPLAVRGELQAQVVDVLLRDEEGAAVAIANANVPNMVGGISHEMAAAGLNIATMTNKSSLIL